MAEVVLQRSFMGQYFSQMQEEGVPLISVTATVNEKDPGTINLTGMERQVGQFLDSKGVVVENPSELQKQSSTLQYLCSANDKKLPGAASFDWNWVNPSRIGELSGVMAVNRKTLGQFLGHSLLSSGVKQNCLMPHCSVSAKALGSVRYGLSFSSGQTPTISVTDTGSAVVHCTYSTTQSDDDKSGLTYGKLEVTSSLDLYIYFEGTSLRIVQHLVLDISATWDYTTEGAKAYDKTLTSTYPISVDQFGALRMGSPVNSLKDDSQKADGGFWEKTFVNIESVVNSYKADFNSLPISELGVNHVSNFVFPGGKVFTFKDGQFSQHQDLISSITYVTPQ